MLSGLKAQSSDHYAQAQAERLASYKAALVDGQYRPFIYPWDSLPALYLLLALVFLPRIPRAYAKVLRWPILALILGHCIYILRVCRSVGLAGGYGIGVSVTWGCIMTFALIVFNDVAVDFKRLEARIGSDHGELNGKQNGHATSSSVSDSQSSQAKARNGMRHDNEEPDNASRRTPVLGTDVPYRLAWQTYPLAISHRVDWVVDLITGFRGVNWNFRDPTLSKLEIPSVHIKANQSFETPITPSNFTSISDVRTQALVASAKLYFMLDVIKYLQASDPYFYGALPIDIGYSSSFYPSSPSITKTARLAITAASVYTTLTLIFQLCPIIFTTIPLLLPYPSILKITRIPLLSASMYEPYWGSPLSSIAAKGLAGFWGRFWHQMFRFGLSQPSAYVIKRYNLDFRSNKARLIQVLAAFFLSGVLHAMASYTSFPLKAGMNHPFTGPWAFFMLQGVGILLQGCLTRAIKSRSFPLWLRQAGNILFVLIWAWYSGPFLADDFARCGVWLFEPLPISFVRGIRGHGWWKWGGRWVGWWSDPEGKWYNIGIAIY